MTHVSGLPEVVAEGRAGLIVPAEDPSPLAAAMNRFFNEELGEGMEMEIIGQGDRFPWSRLVVVIGELGNLK